jgi:CO/xanthine dehydrogenase Mo-binding subunit
LGRPVDPAIVHAQSIGAAAKGIGGTVLEAVARSTGLP